MSGADGPFESPIPRWEYETVAAVLLDRFGLEGELSPLEGERGQNLRLDTGEGRFVVKIANPAEPIDALDMQQAALEHLAATPGVVEVPRVVRTRDRLRVAVVDHRGTRYPVRVLTFLEGRTLRDDAGAVGRREVGATVAGLQRSLQGFFHPAAGRRFLWDVRNVADLRPRVGSVADARLRRRVTEVLDRVEASVLPILARLPAQVIHNDLNPDNVLVAGGAVSGVVDFGDMLHGPRVADLAVAASYQLAADDPAAAIGEVCRGYQSVIHLSEAELAVLADLVAVRLCLSVVIGAWRASRHPENARYILGDAAESAAGLAAMEDLDGVRRRLAATPSAPAEAPVRQTTELLAARRRSMAPGLRLWYDEPLHLVSGRGVRVRDAAGREYLDAYNNVVQVGHGHPAIVRALARQAGRLNTNTRYLVDSVVGYAERLTALLPAGLDVCYFTNSGSEANDLALRIARTVTGAEGVVVTQHAYHGATAAVMAMSPEELRPDQGAPWVATVQPPGGGDPGAQRAVDSLRAAGAAPAAIFLDTIFSSDGIHAATADYLDSTVEVVRAAGGLFVADEVQAGLGRVGPRLWGFAAGAQIPDVVTLGKPIGNGHPIGVVVTSHAIAGRFAEDGYYFSTFGGNSVSAAVGLAVLDVTAEEGLPERAERVGGYLRSRISEIDSTAIGAVRGAGLFIGVEIRDAGGRPDGAGARSLVEAMRQRGVLIGRTGPHENVLKIRPPLVFEEHHADLLIDALRGALAGGQEH